jgi:hypothetical protein
MDQNRGTALFGVHTSNFILLIFFAEVHKILYKNVT